MTTKQETALAIRGMVEKRVENSAAIIKAAGYDPEQYAAVVLNAMVVNPSLAECTKQSLEKSIIDCLNAGLLPDGKQAAIVPFKGRNGAEATLIPMVDGIVKLAHNAIKGLGLRARVVYKGDHFEYSDGAHITLNHTEGAFCDPPRVIDKRPENIIAAYAVAKQPGHMEPDILVMDRAGLDIYRGYSRSRSGPWETHYAQMCQKTVIKQLLKLMPKVAASLPDVPAGLERYELEAMSEVDDYAAGVVSGTGSDGTVYVASQSIVDAEVPLPETVTTTNANPETGEMPMPVEEPEPEYDDDEAPF